MMAVGAAAAPTLPDAPGTPFGRHPNALWRVVHDLCVPDRLILGLPAPCLAVDLHDGYAVVKDTRERSHVLLVPTRRVSGIESPSLLAPGAPNDWRNAWAARRAFEALVGGPVPRGEFGLVINSRFGRTQDQLHIHIDCLWSKVALALDEAAPHLGAAWAPLDIPFLDTRFEARRIDGADLVRNPFELLAKGDARARADMGEYTLAAVPETFPDGRDGFILLAHAADLPHGDPAAGEMILDHKCRILRPAASAGQ